MTGSRSPLLRGSVLPLVLAVTGLAPSILAGCAGKITQGAASGISWRVAELQTSERPGTMPGYSTGGVVRVFRYVIILQDTRGVGATFREVESLQLVGSGFRATPRTSQIFVKLPPNGEARVAITDSSWAVLPRWQEGAERPVNLNPGMRKTITGMDDQGQPIRLVIEYMLNDIPPLTPTSPAPNAAERSRLL